MAASVLTAFREVGFNWLEITAMQPAAFKAAVLLCSADDRYADDIHYRCQCRPRFGQVALLRHSGQSATESGQR